MNFSFYLAIPFLVITLVVNGQVLFEETDDQFVQQIENTYQKGIDFLAKTQNDQGSWDDSTFG